MDTVFVLTFTDWPNSKRWGDRPFAAAVSLDLAKADAADVATHSLGDMVVDDWSEIVDGDWETPVWVAPVVEPFVMRRQVGVFEIRACKGREG